MPVGAAIGSVAGGVIGAFGASDAAATQAGAADDALSFQKKMYKQSRSDLMPYNEVGQDALYSLASLFGLPGEDGTVKPADYSSFYSSPDYQFAKTEGINALDASAAAKGSLLSGGQLKALEEYGSGLATQNYGNYVNRLLQLATIGENAGARTGASAMSLGQSGANTMLAGGAATAAGTVGAFNNIGGGISDAFSTLATSGALGGSAYSGSTPVGSNALDAYNYGL